MSDSIFGDGRYISQVASYAISNVFLAHPSRTPRGFPIPHVVRLPGRRRWCNALIVKPEMADLALGWLVRVTDQPRASVHIEDLSPDDIFGSMQSAYLRLASIELDPRKGLTYGFGRWTWSLNHAWKQWQEHRGGREIFDRLRREEQERKHERKRTKANRRTTR